MNVSAADDFVDHDLIQSGQAPVPVDMTSHINPLLNAYTPLAEIDATGPGDDQITMNYALLAIN